MVLVVCQNALLSHFKLNKGEFVLQKMRRRISIAITGASGAQYALRLIKVLVASDVEVSLLLSKAAVVVMNTETDLQLDDDHERASRQLREYVQADTQQLTLYAQDDWFSPVASGSGAPSAMVVCPASGGTLSAIANGASNNLIERAADVVLKEGHKLILVTRECPVSTIHLENMLKLSKMGVVIMPASPGFYNKPQSIEDLVDFMVARILDQLGVEQVLQARWGMGSPE